MYLFLLCCKMIIYHFFFQIYNQLFLYIFLKHFIFFQLSYHCGKQAFKKKKGNTIINCIFCSTSIFVCLNQHHYWFEFMLHNVTDGLTSLPTHTHTHTNNTLSLNIFIILVAIFILKNNLKMILSITKNICRNSNWNYTKFIITVCRIL